MDLKFKLTILTFLVRFDLLRIVMSLGSEESTYSVWRWSAYLTKNNKNKSKFNSIFIYHNYVIYIYIFFQMSILFKIMLNRYFNKYSMHLKIMQFDYPLC